MPNFLNIFYSVINQNYWALSKFWFFFLELILLKSSCKATGCIHMLQIRQRKFKTISKWCVSFIPFLLFSFLFFFFLLQKSHFVISILKELIDNWYLVFLQNYKEEAWKEMKFYKSLSSFFFNICISRYICVSYIHISLNIKQSNRD